VKTGERNGLEGKIAAVTPGGGATALFKASSVPLGVKA